MAVDRRSVLLGAGGALMGGLAPKWASAAPAGAFRLVVLGDCVFTRRLSRDYAPLQKLLPMLRGADATIANFEGALPDAGAWATAFGGPQSKGCSGYPIRGEAGVAQDVAWMGVKMVGTANNHAGDWGVPGILSTAAKLRAASLSQAGTGKDLKDARKAAYFDSPKGRTALISCASSFTAGSYASDGFGDLAGRPGLSPVRLQGDGIFPKDLNEIMAAVREARANADYVVVSCHSHEGDGAAPAPFSKQLAHACIDAGADVYFSHGPHTIRPIEIYKGKVIFYSIGAFIWRTLTDEAMPLEVYDSCGVTSHNTVDYFNKISVPWFKEPSFWDALVPQIDFEKGKIVRITLTPTMVEHADAAFQGMPYLADAANAKRILSAAKDVSAPYGTTIAIDGSAGRITL